MQIKTFASGSKANGYHISDGETGLLIEAGVSPKKICREIDRSEINGLLCTHFHLDHSKYLENFMKMAVNCYSSAGTFEALNIKSHRAKVMKSKELLEVGTFQILPFDTQHDCAEPLGFLIYSTLTGEKLLFATDTYYVKYRFSGLTHLLIECNWSEKTLDPDCAYLPRLRKSHFSLVNVIKFLNANDLSNVEEIHLLHLSENNADSGFFKEEIQKATGKIVYIAGEENV